MIPRRITVVFGTSEHIIKGEDAGRGNGELSGLIVSAAAFVLSCYLSVGGIHDEIVAATTPEMDVVASKRHERHIKVSIDPNSEGLLATVNPGATTVGNYSAALAVTGKGFHCLRGTLRNELSSDMDLVKVPRDTCKLASEVLVLLVVQARLIEIRTIGVGSDFIDRNEGRLNQRSRWRTRRVVGICILSNFEAVRSSIAVCVDQKWIGAWVVSTHKDPCRALLRILKSVSISIRVKGVSACADLRAVKEPVVVRIVVGIIGAGRDLRTERQAVEIEVAGGVVEVWVVGCWPTRTALEGEPDNSSGSNSCR